MQLLLHQYKRTDFRYYPAITYCQLNGKRAQCVFSLVFDSLVLLQIKTNIWRNSDQSKKAGRAQYLPLFIKKK